MGSGIKDTGYYSKVKGKLAKGCQLCVHGKKLVLFITGICAQRCYYCPISEKKFGKDVVHANEWQVKNPNKPKELIEEAKLTEAKGAGITGGDPLANVARCVKYIRLLKKKFGRKFHIHLYTALKLVNKERLEKIYRAGLDEIRFHPDLDNDALWPRLELALKYNWDVGVEIPAVPGKEKQIKKLVDYIKDKDKVKFLNLNELELSDTKVPHYNLDGFKPKNKITYGVKGSWETAKRIMEYAKNTKLNIHFCTAKLKDKIQVGNRIKRRQKNVAKVYDVKTKEGTLVRGCIYAESLQKLRKIKSLLQKELKVPAKLLDIDAKKKRITTAVTVVSELKDWLKKEGVTPAIVEEYPTHDALKVDVIYL